MKRRLPVGAEVQPDGGVHFRVWAPASKTVTVELLDGNGRRERQLSNEGNGYFSGLVSEASAGSLYKYALDHGSFPDPVSRFQPEGPHGPSQVVDPETFRWRNATSNGVQDNVIYEMHIGTFTLEGTWAAAAEQLSELKRLGVTVIEMMPVAEFSGKFGWGYDGVDLFAPTRLYGAPDDLRRFVDRAHEVGLIVILDVVYNHIGPDGNYLAQFSEDYFTHKYQCEWGAAMNFDGENATPVREFFISNARYWIDEYRFDGLRLDATQQIFDESEPHIILEITEAARNAARERSIYIVGENEPQDSRLARSKEHGGYGLSALWNDDYHHSARVAATGRSEAYYRDYKGSPQELISAIKHGYLYQGQWYSWQQKRRGSPARDLRARTFVLFLENHDQIANSLRGQRLQQMTSPGRFRALTALTLLAPGSPMLFQGQEFGSSAPFLFFADHNPELSRLVNSGRHDFLRQFPSVACVESDAYFAEPSNPDTFARCKLDFRERERNSGLYRLHADLLRLRREDRTIAEPAWVDGAVLGAESFVIRYGSAKDDDRILLVNLGADLQLSPVPEPLLAPIPEHGWRILWSSEHPVYGGSGTPPVETANGWMIPGHAAVLLEPDEHTKLPNARLSQDD